jgi:hypothetical protein
MTGLRTWLRADVLAILVPLVGIGVMVARAEQAASAGPLWRIEIAGFDPRDLLHGHYLQYRYEFQRSGAPSTCGPTTADFSDDIPLDPACCLCLERADDFLQPPWVHQVSCEEALACDGLLRSDLVTPPLRWFAPEDRALDLEQALRVHQPTILLRTSPEGHPALVDLHLDGRPWRDVVGTRGSPTPGG